MSKGRGHMIGGKRGYVPSLVDDIDQAKPDDAPVSQEVRDAIQHVATREATSRTGRALRNVARGFAAMREAVRGASNAILAGERTNELIGGPVARYEAMPVDEKLREAISHAGMSAADVSDDVRHTINYIQATYRVPSRVAWDGLRVTGAIVDEAQPLADDAHHDAAQARLDHLRLSELSESQSATEQWHSDVARIIHDPGTPAEEVEELKVGLARIAEGVDEAEIDAPYLDETAAWVDKPSKVTKVYDDVPAVFEAMSKVNRNRLIEMKRDELRKLAGQHGVPGYRKMTKAELIDALL